MVRGEIFRLRPPRLKRGHEQQGGRYGVVVQADVFLGLSTVLISPTSTRAAAAGHRPEIEVDGTLTKVIVEQTNAMDPQRLGPSAGHLDAAEMREVDEALALVLGL